MKILVAGANGYVGGQLIVPLLEEGHQVAALVRRACNFEIPEKYRERFEVIQGDLAIKSTLSTIPKDLDAAYYLVHSLAQGASDLQALEIACAQNFIEAMKKSSLKQIIFLGGISHEGTLSPHLASRKAVASAFENSGIPYTILNCAIILGSRSASFNMIRDLTEKLPVMVVPRWAENKTQPIAIKDVIFYLKGVLNNPKAINKTFEIGGPERLSYKEMLERYAHFRGLKRFIFKVPVLTPRLSSYWLYFVTSTNFTLAASLVESLRNETICNTEPIQSILPHQCGNYEESLTQIL